MPHPFDLTLSVVTLSYVALVVALVEVATVDRPSESISGWLTELAVCD